MNKSITPRRAYSSERRAAAAQETRTRILDAARDLLGRDGIDRTTIADIARAAGVAAPTVYAVLGSKEGILRALMERALFGEAFRSAQALLAGVTDAVEAVALTPRVSRAIYEGESNDLGLLRSASGFSPALGEMEQEFERIRYEMQEARVRALFDAGRNRPELSFDEARRVLWMFTSRDVYRMMVVEGGWSGERYQAWLARTLLDALVDERHRPPS